MELPENERLEVADAIWASLGDLDSQPLPTWQRDLLEERLASVVTEAGRDWDEVRAEIWPSSR